MMLILENIKLALTAIKSNKMRSFLTMLGIIIGISSVIAITAIGDSVKATIGKEFDAFGKNNVIIYQNWSMADEEGTYVYEDNMFLEDLESLKERFPKETDYIAPYVSVSAKSTIGRVSSKWAIQGVGADYDKFKNIKMIKGRMPNKADIKGNRPFIVVSEAGAEYFFNTTEVLGRTLSLPINEESKEFTIIGVFSEEKTLFSGMMYDQSSFNAFAPYTMLMWNQDDVVYNADIYVNQAYDSETTAAQMAEYMTKLKGKQKDFFTYQTVQAQQGMMDQMLGTLSLAIGAIAAISLVVGGIGIMNIMLVSVTERTREIGIRKALGARTKDVLMQFLVESMITSAIGGLIGSGLGVGLAVLGMTIAGAEISINPMVIVFAVAFSAGVGMFFGLYPAKKAAKLDPIEALRYE